MIRSILASLILVCSAAAAAGTPGKDAEQIHRTLKFTGVSGTHRLTVDNISGSIRVTGYDGTTVEMIASRTIHADSDDKREEAKNKVTLDITEKANDIVLFVDAPWRTRDGGTDYRGHDHYGYDVSYDFELKIPVKTDVVLKTVNGGEIEVTNVVGNFVVKNVNGSVNLQDMAGSGEASTVNGSVDVRFRENPHEASAFSTVNGKVTVQFEKSLAASLRFQTLNGEVFSDFNVTKENLSRPFSRKYGNRSVYKASDSFGVQVGTGGPEMKFSTINGNIYILKNESGRIQHD